MKLALMNNINPKERHTVYAPRIYRGDYFIIKHLHKFINSSIDQYVTTGSKIVDVGCGEQPIRSLIEKRDAQYISVDVVQNSKNNVDIVCSAASIELPSNFADIIFCTEVIEHISDTDKAFSELTRILRWNGYIILTIPFSYCLHEEPYDFIRPTPYLIQVLADKYFLKVVTLEKTGNELEVIGTIFDNIFSQHKFHRKLVWLFFAFFRFFLRLLSNTILYALSKIFNKVLQQKFYLNTVAVLQKVGRDEVVSE